jgi:hypothetical protein
MEDIAQVLDEHNKQWFVDCYGPSAWDKACGRARLLVFNALSKELKARFHREGASSFNALWSTRISLQTFAYIWKEHINELNQHG